jgi:hypothetical protein
MKRESPTFRADDITWTEHIWIRHKNQLITAEGAWVLQRGCDLMNVFGFAAKMPVHGSLTIQDKGSLKVLRQRMMHQIS